MTSKETSLTRRQGTDRTLGKVYVVDPDGIGNRYDPLLAKRTEKDLLSAATHLLYRPDEGEGRIFTERATVMLTQLLLACGTRGTRTAFSLRPADGKTRASRQRKTALSDIR